MTHGGARGGAGRKKGAPNKVTAEKRAELEASGELPLDYMLRVMRTAKDDRRCDDMARAAAPYLHPRLESVEHKGAVEFRRADEWTDDEIARRLAELDARRRSGASHGNAEAPVDPSRFN